MKIPGVILSFVWMVSAATLALAETPKSVSVTAGDLTEAVESLAKQCGVDVIYNSGLVRGQKTGGVTGRLKPTEAFKELLEGTPLEVRKEGDALLITKATRTPPPGMHFDMPAVAAAQGGTEPIDEVTIEAARREKLSALRARLNALEERFYAAYNKVNDIPDYSVRCSREMRGLNWVHVCAPKLKQTCSGTGGFSGEQLNPAPSDPGLCTTWLPPVEYRQHLLDAVAQHPDLLEILKERQELAEHYEAVRREKFKGKLFVWD